MGAKIVMVKVGSPLPANVKNYQGIYIEARRNGRDNPELVSLFDAAKSSGVKVGWFITLDPGERETYAVQLREFSGVLNNRPGDISPAVIIETIGGRTPHQFRGDFSNYFKTFTDTHPRVLLGMNSAVKAQITNPAGDTDEDYQDFWRIMSNGDRCRLWLWQYAGTPNPAPFIQFHLLSTGATAHEWRGDLAQFYKDNNLPVPPSTPTTPPAALTGQLLIDIWEGNPSLDADVLIAAGVKGCIVRLNDMSGGHHMDSMFAVNWAFAQQFDVSAVYFVYNPWVTGRVNYDWLTAHLPAGYNLRLFADVEVRYEGYSPATYAAEVADFVNRCKAGGLNVTIYSGAWFKSYLSAWPMACDYWWAAYPTALTTCSTWDAYKTTLAGMNFSAWTNTAPGKAALWQCSGDKPVSLPGCGGHPVDVNLFPGTLDELRAWAGVTVEPPDEPTDAEKLALLWAWYKESHS